MYTGGSTGSQLAFIFTVKGYPLEIVTSDVFAQEKIQTMVAFGAHLHLIPSVNCQVTPDLTPLMIDAAQAIAKQPGSYSTNQLHNPDVVKGYKMLGCELLAQVEGSIHSICGSVGTSGMLMKVLAPFERSEAWLE